MKHMETDALLALLEQAYPTKTFTREPYEVAGATRSAIILTQADVAIHDPFVTDCVRFPQDDYYGLTDKHARLLRRHNREYARYVLGQTSDLPFIFDRLVELVKSQPDLDPSVPLDDFGFIQWHTGGGCMSYALFNPDGCHILVTDNGGTTLPTRMGEAWIGLYDYDDAELKGFFPEPVDTRPLAETLVEAQSSLLTMMETTYPATQKDELQQALAIFQSQVQNLVNQWLNRIVPDGSTVRTEDGYTFVLGDGKWTDGDMTFNGLTDFQVDLKITRIGLETKEKGRSAESLNTAEVVADIAFIAGHLASRNEITVTDSRSLMHDCTEWAKQFEDAFNRERHGDSYLELIDDYASHRLHGEHDKAESVLVRMNHS